MSPLKLRPIAAAATLGGACWLVFAISSVASGGGEDVRTVLETTGDYLGYSLFALCLALAVPAILAVHLHQRGADGRLGRSGAIVAMAGAAGQCVVISGIVVNGGDPPWFGIAAPIAIATWFAGSVLLGIATRRGGLLPKWVGLALPIATLFAIVGADYGSSALIAAFQLIVGVRILRATADGSAGPAPASVARV